jgi:hypothetical protein
MEKMYHGDKCLRKSKFWKIYWAEANGEVVIEKFKTYKSMTKRFDELMKISNTVHTFNPDGTRGWWI